MYDVIIIGAGPAGISAALYLKRAGYNPLIIEKNSPGGTLNKIYKLDNYPGYVDSDGSTLAFRMYSQIEQIGVDLKLEVVTKIVKENEVYKLYTNKSVYHAKYIIISTGKTPKKLEVTNSDKYDGKGISYCALCDGMLYKDKTVAVVGGGNSAIGAVKYLSNIVNKIYLINRSNNLRADKSEQSDIFKLNNVEIIYNKTVKEIIGDDDNINEVILNDNTKLDVQAVFVLIGSIVNSSFYNNLNIKEDDKGIIVDNNMMTSINNVYACGDIISKDVYQVITAVGEGVIAANSIIQKLQKNKNDKN